MRIGRLGGAERAGNRYIAIVYGDEDIICGFALLEIMRERDAQSAEYFFISNVRAWVFR